MDRIERFFHERGSVMTENNRRQALAIEGGTPLPNETGLAVGNAVSHEGTHYIVLPGPPKELMPMFEQEAKPWLRMCLPESFPSIRRCSNSQASGVRA